MNSESQMNTETSSPEQKLESSSKESKPKWKPSDLVNSSTPHIVVGDQYVVTQKWPDKKCSCKGVGHYGLLAPRQLAEKFPVEPNERCVCLSGKKYKRCCQERVERLQKAGHRIVMCQCVGTAELAENPFLEQMREELRQALEKRTSTDTQQ